MISNQNLDFLPIRMYGYGVKIHAIPMIAKAYNILLAVLIIFISFGFYPFIFDEFELPKFIGLLIVGTLFSIILVFTAWNFFYKIPIVFKIFILLYFFGQVSAFILSINRKISLIGSPFRYQGLVSNLLYLVILLSGIYFFYYRKRQVGRTFVFWFSLSSTLVAVMAIFSYTGVFFNPVFFEGRAYATFGNPNFLASYLAASFPLVFLFPWRVRVVVDVLIAAALLCTGSRSSWASLIAGIFIFGATIYLKEFKTKILYAGILLVAVVAVLFYSGSKWYSHQPILRRFSFNGEAGQSIITRKILWRTGLKMYAARPFFGYGQDTLQERIDQFLPVGVHDQRSLIYIDRLHSEAEDLIVTGGALSFIGYYGLAVVLLWKIAVAAWRKKLTSLDLAIFSSYNILLLYHLVNFSTITSNVIWYIETGYLIKLFVEEPKYNENNIRTGCD